MNAMNTPNPLRFIRQDIQSMHAYAIQDSAGMVKLDAMENPYALSPALQAELGARLGAVAILAFVSPTIEAFFTWQACVGLGSAIAMRTAAWRIIGRTGQHRFDTAQLKRVWRFTAGMGGVGVTALVFTQLDKVILSKMLGLGEFGHYMLATVVVSGLYVLVAPLFNVIYPRFSALVVTTFQAARPWLMWSSEANLRASRYGSS